MINGVPRMLPVSLRPNLVKFHREFFDRHPDLTPENRESPDEKMVRTLEGFSHQHVELNDRQREVERWRENFVSAIPVGPDFFEGKIGEI